MTKWNFFEVECQKALRARGHFNYFRTRPIGNINQSAPLVSPRETQTSSPAAINAPKKLQRADVLKDTVCKTENNNVSILQMTFQNWPIRN